MRKPAIKLTEAQVVNQIKGYLAAKRYFWWVQKTMGVYDAARKCYRKDKTLRRGVSDIAVLHRGTYYAIEAKRSTGGVWSAEQRQFKADVEANGGVYILARSVDDLMEWGL